MKKMRQCMITSNLSHLSISTIKKVLNDNKELFINWAYIIHDKDTYTQEEYDFFIKNHNQEPTWKVGDLKNKHVHLILKLNNAYTFSVIAKKFGINDNFVETIKGRFKDALKYLTHENAPNKYQYSEDEVKSNFDWLEEKKKLSFEERKEEIIDKIDEGVYTEYNIDEYISTRESIYFSSIIEKSLKHVRRLRERKLQKEGRNMEVIYIQGEAQSGKTTYAKDIAKRHNLDACVSSGSNDLLDNYKGEPCLILDDLRPSCLGLSDLLKMLDNNTSSSVKSRYYNKTLFCDLVIITTTKDINTYFNEVFENEDEPKTQLLRRCKTLIKMDEKHIQFFKYNKKTKTYDDYGLAENTFATMYDDDEKTIDEKYDELSELVGLNNLKMIRTAKEDWCKKSFELKEKKDN